jgi:hypothetical protein
MPGLVRRAVVLKRGRVAWDGDAPSTGDGFRALYRDHVHQAGGAA